MLSPSPATSRPGELSRDRSARPFSTVQPFPSLEGSSVAVQSSKVISLLLFSFSPVFFSLLSRDRKSGFLNISLPAGRPGLPIK